MASNFAPAGASPPGVKPNFIDPESLYPEILATVILCCALTTLFAAARLIAKRSYSPWTLEDYVLIVAWAVNIAYDFLFLAQGRAGIGRHLWDIRAVDAPLLSQLSWAIEILYGPAIWLAKAALLLQLMHIFTPTKSGPVYWVIHALLWGNLAFYTSTLFTVIFECIPPKKIWTPLYQGGHCIDINTALLATGAVNVVSDFLILLLPLWATWHLRMAPKRKVWVCAIFATGLIAFASSICRLAYTAEVPHTADSTYIIAQVAMWTLAELASIILCTCFPMMPLFTRLILGRNSGSKAGSSHRSVLGSKMPYSRSKTKSGGNNGGGTVKITHGPYGSPPWAEGGEQRGQLNNKYIPLEETGRKEMGRTNIQAGQTGIQKTVSIELTSQEQFNAETRTTSLV